MPEKKRFRCEICDYILEHDGDGELPPCPECGDANSWLLLDADAAKKAAISEPAETGFSQVIPHDITEGDVSAVALGNIALAPAETTADERGAGTDPFARPAETGFEHAVPADITERVPAQVEMGQLDSDQGKPIKLDEYPFKRPHDTGFEQIVPTDITEGDTSRAAYGSIVGPSGDEGPTNTQAFARPAETGFEQVIPNDITESTSAALPGAVTSEGDAGSAGVKIDDYAFKRPHDTGFEQIVPADITEGDTSRAAYGSIIGPSGDSHGDSQAFAPAQETGFEQVIPTDITEGDTSRAAYGSIGGPQDDDEPGDGQAFARPETTGFEQVIPVDFTEGVGSSVDVAALPKDEADADRERKPGVNPFAQPEETGFEQVIPQDFTEGGKVNIALGERVSQQQATAMAKRFRCEVCGALLETDQEGDLPPCSTCGELGKWVQVKE